MKMRSHFVIVLFLIGVYGNGIEESSKWDLQEELNYGGKF